MDAPPPLHELETEIMEEMWGRAEATVRDVQEALNARGGEDPRVHDAADGHDAARRQGPADPAPRGPLRRLRRHALARGVPRRARRGSVEALVEDFGDLALAHFARHIQGLDQQRLETLRRLAESDD